MSRWRVWLHDNDPLPPECEQVVEAIDERHARHVASILWYEREGWDVPDREMSVEPVSPQRPDRR